MGTPRILLTLKEGIWWVTYVKRGVQWDEPTGTGDRRQAELFAQRCLGHYATPPRTEEGGMSLAGARRVYFTDYQINGRRTVARATIAWNHIEHYFRADCKLNEITGDRLLDYAAQRMQKVARGTVLYELRVLHRALALLLTLGQIDKLPQFPKIKDSPPRKGFFEDHEFEGICNCLPPWALPVVRALYWTGWRCGEIMSLQWRQVDFMAQTMRLEPGTTKNEEGRVFPFGKLAPLRHILESQRRFCDLLEKQMGRVIPWVFFKPSTGKPVSDMRYAWKVACRRACLPGKLMHDLRRTAVRRMERAGVPRRVAMQLTGHLSESVYQRYAIVNEADLHLGVEKIELHRLNATSQNTHSNIKD